MVERGVDGSEGEFGREKDGFEEKEEVIRREEEERELQGEGKGSNLNGEERRYDDVQSAPIVSTPASIKTYDHTHMKGLSGWVTDTNS